MQRRTTSLFHRVFLLAACAIFFAGCRGKDPITALIELWGGFLLWTLVVPAGVALLSFSINLVQSGVVVARGRTSVGRVLSTSLVASYLVFIAGPIALLLTKIAVLDLELFSQPDGWPSVVEVGDTYFPTLGAVVSSVTTGFAALVSLVVPWKTPARPATADATNEAP